MATPSPSHSYLNPNSSQSSFPASNLNLDQTSTLTSSPQPPTPDSIHSSYSPLAVPYFPRNEFLNLRSANPNRNSDPSQFPLLQSLTASLGLDSIHPLSRRFLARKQPTNNHSVFILDPNTSEHDSFQTLDLTSATMDTPNTPSTPKSLKSILVDELDLHPHLRDIPLTPLLRAAACIVCFSPPNSNMRTCPLCFIHTCHQCFASWLHIRIQGGHAKDLTCLKCVAKISSEEVEQYCGPSIAKKHLYYLSKYEHRNNPHAAWCPQDDCWKLLRDKKPNSNAADSKLITCPDCKSQLCINCLSFKHEGERCPSPQFHLGQRALAHFWQRMHTKKCPKCSVRIQRAGGCTQMCCTSCHTKFCWRCRGALNGPVMAEGGRRTLRGCICPRTTEAFVMVGVAGGVFLLATPLVLAAAAVVGPPALVVYVALPREKKEMIKTEFSNVFNGI